MNCMHPRKTTRKTGYSAWPWVGRKPLSSRTILKTRNTPNFSTLILCWCADSTSQLSDWRSHRPLLSRKCYRLLFLSKMRNWRKNACELLLEYLTREMRWGRIYLNYKYYFLLNKMIYLPSLKNKYCNFVGLSNDPKYGFRPLGIRIRISPSTIVQTSIKFCKILLIVYFLVAKLKKLIIKICVVFYHHFYNPNLIKKNKIFLNILKHTTLYYS